MSYSDMNNANFGSMERTEGISSPTSASSHQFFQPTAYYNYPYVPSYLNNLYNSGYPTSANQSASLNMNYFCPTPIPPAVSANQSASLNMNYSFPTPVPPAVPAVSSSSSNSPLGIAFKVKHLTTISREPDSGEIKDQNGLASSASRSRNDDRSKPKDKRDVHKKLDPRYIPKMREKIYKTPESRLKESRFSRLRLKKNQVNMANGFRGFLKVNLPFLANLFEREIVPTKYLCTTHEKNTINAESSAMTLVSSSHHSRSLEMTELKTEQDPSSVPSCEWESPERPKICPINCLPEYSSPWTGSKCKIGGVMEVLSTLTRKQKPVAEESNEEIEEGSTTPCGENSVNNSEDTRGVQGEKERPFMTIESSPAGVASPNDNERDSTTDSEKNARNESLKFSSKGASSSNECDRTSRRNLRRFPGDNSSERSNSTITNPEEGNGEAKRRNSRKTSRSNSSQRSENKLTNPRRSDRESRRRVSRSRSRSYSSKHSENKLTNPRRSDRGSRRRVSRSRSRSYSPKHTENKLTNPRRSDRGSRRRVSRSRPRSYSPKHSENKFTNPRRNDRGSRRRVSRSRSRSYSPKHAENKLTNPRRSDRGSRRRVSRSRSQSYSPKHSENKLTNPRRSDRRSRRRVSRSRSRSYSPKHSENKLANPRRSDRGSRRRVSRSRSRSYSSKHPENKLTNPRRSVSRSRSPRYSSERSLSSITSSKTGDLITRGMSSKNMSLNDSDERSFDITLTATSPGENGGDTIQSHIRETNLLQDNLDQTKPASPVERDLDFPLPSPERLGISTHSVRVKEEPLDLFPMIKKEPLDHEIQHFLGNDLDSSDEVKCSFLLQNMHLILNLYLNDFDTNNPYKEFLELCRRLSVSNIDYNPYPSCNTWEQNLRWFVVKMLYQQSSSPTKGIPNSPDISLEEYVQALSNKILQNKAPSCNSI